MKDSFIEILSIDDSKAVHAFLDRCLGNGPYKLTHSLDPREGLKLLVASPDRFSLVLLDWEMPELSGPEVLAEARKSGVRTPIIMLTSKNDNDDILRALTAGANEYVMKPFTPDILLEKIEAVRGARS